ncbi:radical SAM protein [candidate division KSB1 bacterium]|nr:radical SAM protein [candidate division KSB1 bacterium]
MSALSRKWLGLAARNPRLAWDKARITLRNRLGGRWDYTFGNGRARPPATLCLKLSNACNLRCRMCGQPRENARPGDPKYAPPDFFRQSVSLDVYQRLIDEMKRFRPTLYLWGGEPFLYPHLFELIARIKAAGLVCQINTNGLLIEKHARELVESGLDDLIVSVDGPAEVHDAVRGRRGVFARLQRGVDALAEARRQLGSRTPVLRVRGTICPENFASLSELPPIARRFGADSLNFNWTWFTTRQAGQAHQALMRRLFDIDARSWIPFLSETVLDRETRLRFEALSAELQKLQRQAGDLPITLSPHIRPDQVESYFTDVRQSFGCRDCFAVYVKSYILPNGDVTPCPDFPDYIAGSIVDKPFLEIWNGEHYRAWRRELKKHRLFPVCTRCCDLYLSSIQFV